MSDRSKKILWIAVAVCGFSLVVLLAVFLVFRPTSETEMRPFDITGRSPAKPAFPNDFSVFPSVVVKSTPPTADTQNTGSSGTSASAGTALPSQTAGTPSASSTTSSKTGTSVVIVPAPSSEPSKEPGSSQPAAAAKTSVPAPSSPAPSSVPAPKATTPKPETTTKPAAPATPSASPVISSEYWIQVGSFSSRAVAEKLREEFTSRGMTSVISEKVIGGKTYHQVKVGPYPSMEEARKWLATVKAVPGSSADAFVTSR
jgi:cell division protein FtsN